MKNSFRVSAFFAALCLFAVSALAQLAPSAFNEAFSSAGPWIGHSESRIRLASFEGAPNAQARVTPVFLPAPGSPNWQSAADKVIQDSLNGVLKTSWSAITNPQDYAVASGTVSWTNLVFSTGTPMWGGSLNPPAPFNAELGGPLAWWLVDLNAVSGQDDVSLDMVELTSWSSDGNILGDSFNFDGLSLTARALVVKANGSLVIAGPTSTRGKRALALVFTRHFDGGGTQAGLDQVRNWVLSKGNYTYTASVKVRGSDAPPSVATLESTVTTPAPVLMGALHGGKLVLHASNLVTGRSYVLYSGTSPSNFSTFEGVIAGAAGQTTATFTPQNAQAFYRLTAQ